jgi:hypothetical protein
MFYFYPFFMSLMFYCFVLNADDEQINFTVAAMSDGEIANQQIKKDEKLNIKVVLTEASRRHIFEGKKTATGFSGGHDWDFHYDNYIKNDPAADVYFDVNLMAFIVKSSKGDSLVDIIDKLKNKKELPYYHTLFPSSFLKTEKIILNSFKKAFISFMLGRGAVNLDKGIFYTENMAAKDTPVLKVAGAFSVAYNEHDNIFEFKIHTFYPDIDWYYRIDFKHNSENLFFHSRFIKYMPCFINAQIKPLWVQRAHQSERLEKSTLYTPKPIALEWNASLCKDWALTLSELSMQDRVDSYLRQEHLKNLQLGRNKKLNFFDFFNFQDSLNDEELDQIVELLKFLIKNFNYTHNNNSLGMLKDAYSKHFSKNKNRLKINTFITENSSVKMSLYLNLHNQDFNKQSNPDMKLIMSTVRFHSLLQIFNDDALKTFFPQQDLRSLRKIVTRFYHNFASFLIPDTSLLSQLYSENFILDTVMFVMDNSNYHTALRLVHISYTEKDLAKFNFESEDKHILSIGFKDNNIIDVFGSNPGVINILNKK